MKSVSQPPTSPEFVQNPYPFYDRLRELGDLVWWKDYKMPVSASYATVSDLLRDRRFGREQPKELRKRIPEHLAPFYAVEAHSMLELEPPRHTRLRGLVLRAFTSRRIAGLAPEIDALCHDLIDGFPDSEFDLLPAFAQELPVRIIARLMGVPEDRSPDLLRWSNAMVGMYQAKRNRADEDRAVAATEDFVAFMRAYVDARRDDPRDDLITHLIAAEEDGEKLSTDELITTLILLLNAGHEATVHTLGNAVKTLLETGLRPHPGKTFTEEVLRHDPPLHMFTRFALEDIEVAGHSFRRGDQVGLLLGAANRDPRAFPSPDVFDPQRTGPAHVSFGAGLHFCVGAPLARLELEIGLRVLFERCTSLQLVEPPHYADVYHFHGLDRLMVRAG